MLCSKLINIIAQVVCGRSAEFVAIVRKLFNASNTVGISFPVLFQKLLQPFKDGNFSILILIENNVCFRHYTLEAITILLYYINEALNKSLVLKRIIVLFIGNFIFGSPLVSNYPQSQDDLHKFYTINN